MYNLKRTKPAKKTHRELVHIKRVCLKIRGGVESPPVLQICLAWITYHISSNLYSHHAKMVHAQKTGICKFNQNKHLHMASFY